MNKPDLTPRQQEAQTVYNQALKRALWLGVLIFIAAQIAVLLLWRLLAPPTSRFPDWLFVAFISPVWLFVHLRATKAVRRAGLLDEESEIITRTATTFAGEDLWFQYPSTPLGKVALIVGFATITALTWWGWSYLAADFFGYALGAFSFALFFCATLLTLATMHQPNASLDERGVFAYRFGFIPALVRWSEIESAIFHRVSSIHSGANLYSVTLKGADDKTLLVLNPNTFMGSPVGWQQRFIAELKRRLTAATPPRCEENLDE